MAGQAVLMWALGMHGTGAVAVRALSEIGTAHEVLSMQASAMIDVAMLRCGPRSKSPLSPMAELSPSCGSHCSSGDL